MKKIIEKVKKFLRELFSFGNDRKIIARSMAYSLLFNIIGVGIAAFEMQY